MPETTPTRILSTPGIKRDGTRLEGDGYIDGQWVRFDRGLPRKMGGYRAVNRYLNGPVRTINAYTQDDLVHIHFGSALRIEHLHIDAGFNSGVVSDRTPPTLVHDPSNLWQFAIDSSDPVTPLLVAQVAPNMVNITNSFGGQLFTGPLFEDGPLTEVMPQPAVPPVPNPGGMPPDPYSVTGGVFALHPYTVIFGNLGYVAWSVPGNPADYINSGAGNANVTHQKIVFGMPLRGNAAGPAALLWSADALVRMSYTGPGPEGSGPVFTFDTITEQSSIMSSSCVLEHDGIYYWAGTDRFLSFNGVVREIPNLFNKDFFFDGLNWPYRQKVFVFKIPRWGEIWWCFPKYPSTEPNWAIIYNVRDNTWYDTELPLAMRTAAVSPGVFRYPGLTGAEPGLYALQTVSVDNAGTGYVVGDLLTVPGSVTKPTVLKVESVDVDGALVTFSVVEVGAYPSPPTSPVAVLGGTGTGASFDVVYEAPYKLWVHETGVDEVDGPMTTPIPSFFETAGISLPVDKQVNKQTRVVYIEPDFVQTGPMSVEVRGNANARAPDVVSEPMVFQDHAATVDDEVIFFKTQRRELRFRFLSNTVGGNYLMGVTLAHMGPGDGTMLG